MRAIFFQRRWLFRHMQFVRRERVGHRRGVAPFKVMVVRGVNVPLAFVSIYFGLETWGGEATNSINNNPSGVWMTEAHWCWHMSPTPLLGAAWHTISRIIPSSFCHQGLPWKRDNQREKPPFVGHTKWPSHLLFVHETERDTPLLCSIFGTQRVRPHFTHSLLT